jgi:mannose-6-phosphate isomerase-like protein (cupin superfamily)
MDHKIVTKPWGYEYIAFQNDFVALKVLHIKHDERTSLHCHPNKSTGLVVVGGEATISFIADETKLTAPAKKMIRRGLFHQTHATSPNGIVMLEIETPVDQDDLVRLRDMYGREDRGYETDVTPKDSDCLELVVPDVGSNKYKLGTSELEICRPLDFESLADTDIVMFLQGGLIKTVNGRQHLVTCPGDVGEIQVVKQVAKEMDGLAEDTIVLYIR